ncbi:MAG: hypothetical protein ACJ76N_20785 [Thermoanaerobaculia bacterium]
MLKNSLAAYRLSGWAVLWVCLWALALAPARGAAQAACSPTPTVLCLQGSRFQAEVTWAVPGFGSGTGKAVSLTGDTGYFWFFSSSNVELVVKVLDGRAVNRHFWVFYGALSDVAYTLAVTDLQTGAKEVFTNPQGRLASASDVTAFNPEPPPAASRVATPAPGGPPSEAPLRLGTEFQANVTTAGDQILPSVAVAPEGGFMVVWTQNAHPAVSSPPIDLFGRIYDAAGTPRTGELRLNDTPLTGYQPRARVAANAAGGYMVVWSDSTFTARLAQARLYSSSGQPLGGVIPLAAGNDAGFPYVSLPDVTADPAGGFLTAWTEHGGLGATALVTQRFNAQGGRLGGPVTFNAQYSYDPPRLAAFPGGGFLVAWAAVGSGTDFFVSDLWAQRLDASGRTAGPSILINPESRQLYGKALIAPVTYADGGFSVLWILTQLLGGPLRDGVYARRFNADGTPAGGITAIRPDPSATTTAPAAVALPSGDTWVVWNHNGAESGIYSGVFDSAWALQGEVTRVSTYRAPLNVQADPAVSAAGVHTVAVWAGGIPYIPIDPVPISQDGSGFGIFGQRFTPAGCALNAGQLCLGGRFRVEVQFTDPRNQQAAAGVPVPVTGDTGAFWFFDRANLELMVKVIDGRAVNGHFWVFYGALSDVAYTITVTDTVTGNQRTYHNAAHHLASGSDVAAFAAPAGSR